MPANNPIDTSTVNAAQSFATMIAVVAAVSSELHDFAAERLKANPLGIYVNAINWSREMGQ